MLTLQDIEEVSMILVGNGSGGGWWFGQRWCGVVLVVDGLGRSYQVDERERERERK